MNILDDTIMKAYVLALKKSYSPSISSIINEFKNKVEKEALDTIYSEVNFEISESDVSKVMMCTRAIHSHYGETMFDAQSVLLKDWIAHIKLLGGSCEK